MPRLPLWALKWETQAKEVSRKRGVIKTCALSTEIHETRISADHYPITGADGQLRYLAVVAELTINFPEENTSCLIRTDIQGGRNGFPPRGRNPEEAKEGFLSMVGMEVTIVEIDYCLRRNGSVRQTMTDRLISRLEPMKIPSQMPEQQAA